MKVNLSVQASGTRLRKRSAWRELLDHLARMPL